MKLLKEDFLFAWSKLNTSNNHDDFTGFIETCMKTVNQHGLCKQKHVGGNQLPFLNKTVKRNYGTHKAKKEDF